MSHKIKNLRRILMCLPYEENGSYVRAVSHFVHHPKLSDSVTKDAVLKL